MWGFGGVLPATEVVSIDQASAVSMIIIMGAVTLLLPNTQQILHIDWPVIDSKPEGSAMAAGLVAWRMSFRSAVITACILTAGITSIGTSTGFLYYKF
jgi:hypothetical protein